MADQHNRYGRAVIPVGFPEAVAYNPPPAPLPHYDLWLLEDPPEDACVLFNRPWTAFRNDRVLTKQVCMTLAMHHLWGMDWTHEFRNTRITYIKGLWKLFYHMPPYNRPKTFAELFDLNRDAGPRLLGYGDRFADSANASKANAMGTGHYKTVDEATAACGRPLVPPKPVSIQHPDMPPPVLEGAIYDLSFEMPQEAQRLNLNPNEVRQYLFPLYRQHLPEDPWHIMGDPYWQPTEIIPENTGNAPESTNNDLPTLADGNPPTSDFPPLPERRHASQNDINKALVEALVKLSNYEIQRDPGAPERGSYSTIHANTIEDLDTIKVGIFPCTSTVSISTRTLDVEPYGEKHAYRGRGPVGSPATVAVDISIVLGMLTEAGCTFIDRYLMRHLLFNECEKAFIEATNMNWDCLSPELSRELRDSFFRKLHLTYPVLGMGQNLPPWAVWTKLIRNFAQFSYGYRDRSHYCSCENKAYEDKPGRIGSCVLPPFNQADRNGVTPATLVSRQFGIHQNWGCNLCQHHRGTGRVTERLITRLPNRLVLLPHPETRILDHAVDFNFEYRDEYSQSRTATYRWLGGIYECGGRFRVYWTEAEPGRVDPGTIRAYDPLSNAGIIVGSLLPSKTATRVPNEWLKSTPSVLIYELVIDPPKNSLQYFGSHVSHMLRNMERKRPTLQGHYLAPRKADREERLLEDEPIPQLSSLGDQFFNLKRPDAGIQLEFNRSVGNPEYNLYSMMAVNPFHRLVPYLFEDVAQYQFPELIPGIPPILPPFPLPEVPRLFESNLTGPTGFFESNDPEECPLGPLELTDLTVPPSPGEIELHRIEAAQSDQRTSLQDMWTEWIEFSPNQSDQTSIGSAQAQSNQSQTLQAGGSMDDVHMVGTSTDPRREVPRRTRSRHEEAARIVKRRRP